MRRAIAVTFMVLPLTMGCHAEDKSGDTVRSAYDNHAAAIDDQAAAQPNPIAKKIYKARAAALREEGKDREKGLEGGTPSSGPDAGNTAR